jgi:hypothetical protein
MKKSSWADSVRNGEVLQRVNGERIILQILKRMNADWIDHILHRNCLLKHLIQGQIEGRINVTGRRGR